MRLLTEAVLDMAHTHSSQPQAIFIGTMKRRGKERKRGRQKGVRNKRKEGGGRAEERKHYY
jgi:hypothetical protein